MIGKMKAVLKAEAAPGAKVALVNIPQIGSRDVLVQVKAASICGSYALARACSASLVEWRC